MSSEYVIWSQFETNQALIPRSIIIQHAVKCASSPERESYQSLKSISRPACNTCRIDNELNMCLRHGKPRDFINRSNRPVVPADTADIII